MKVVILAGGLGTRMGAATADCPKPMVPIGGAPILWHLIRYYASFGHRDFLIAAGYRGDCILRFFDSQGSPVPGNSQNPESTGTTFDCQGIHVSVVDTGSETDTGGRVKRLADHLHDAPFMLTWGDGLADVDLASLRSFHTSHGRLATVTAVRPPERFGRLTLCDSRVVGFEEKPQHSTDWINGAFFVVHPDVLQLISGDDSSWERDVMPQLAEQQQLMAWKHDSFWQCMDTPKEHRQLETLWSAGTAPWKRWT